MTPSGCTQPWAIAHRNTNTGKAGAFCRNGWTRLGERLGFIALCGIGRKGVAGEFAPAPAGYPLVRRSGRSPALPYPPTRSILLYLLETQPVLRLWSLPA